MKPSGPPMKVDLVQSGGLLRNWLGRFWLPCPAAELV